jgi:hypothetical protein
MVTLLRRCFLVALLAGAAYAGFTVWRSGRSTADTHQPEWPPLPTDNSAAGTEASTPADRPTAVGWVEPVDGECPSSHPIKANAKSGIYHLPGGRFYDRTVPERCYADEPTAIADGYRASKS